MVEVVVVVAFLLLLLLLLLVVVVVTLELAFGGDGLVVDPPRRFRTNDVLDDLWKTCCLCCSCRKETGDTRNDEIDNDDD